MTAPTERQKLNLGQPLAEAAGLKPALPMTRSKVQPLDQCLGSSAFSLSMMRPYDGARHTPAGLKGLLPMGRLTLRDVCDALTEALLALGGVLDDDATIDHLAEVDMAEVDPFDLLRCFAAFVEQGSRQKNGEGPAAYVRAALMAPQDDPPF